MHRYVVLLPVFHFPGAIKEHASRITTCYPISPGLRLNGNWQEEAGFSTDTPIIVSVEQGRLVIEPVEG